MTMRIAATLLFSSILLAPDPPSQAQAAPTPAPITATTPPTASSILSPTLDYLRQSLPILRLDKWKASRLVHEETGGNIDSLTRDLNNTLPPLLAAADAAPGAVSQNLPVFRNVNALYEVLLRVVATADRAAPKGDADMLHQALNSLEDRRRVFGDTIENTAVAQEQQLGSLRDQLRAQALAPARPVGSAGNSRPVPPPPHKRKPAE